MNYHLSIVIPTYKRTDSVTELLRLLKQQTILNKIEIIIVDQNEKGFLADRIGYSILENVRHLYQEEPNVSLARNFGAMEANADIILFLDDDTLPGETFCEKGLEIVNSDSKIQVLSPVILRKGEEVATILPGRVKNSFFKLSMNDKYLHASFFSISAAAFYKKDAFFKSGGFDPFLFRFAGTAEDQEFFIRLLNKQIGVYLCKQLSIYLNEDISGGCELRTVNYWITRQKCMKAWAYRCRMHNDGQHKLRILNILELCRSAFLNRSILIEHPAKTLRQIKLLKIATEESKKFILKLVSENKINDQMNYLER